ncbi:MAG: ATP-dependent DNA helicase RecG, partial [Candidatus Omnitrophica bacterium]|nr:ATP-dependent DNA helicase RecG [Candidatus Omnitrophota bacterium]
MISSNENRHTPVPIRYIKGVGPKKALLFLKLGIENVQDLFYYLPRRYEDRSNISKIKDLRPGEAFSVNVSVLKSSLFSARTGTVIFDIEVGDDTGRAHAVWYNMPFLKKTLPPGRELILYGKVDPGSRHQFTHPAFDIVENEGQVSLEVKRIVPVYPLTAELTEKYVRRTMYNAIEQELAHVPEGLPTYLRARGKLVDFNFAVRNIHFPSSMDNLQKAYRRLVFEEFFTLQVIMALRKKKAGKNGIKHDVRSGLMKEFRGLFDFTLTPDQEKCINDIERDMSSDRPMNRLLQGDVGSGKTVVAMYAMLLSVIGGHQAVMMAPTEILARQHFVTVSKIFMPLGLNVRLLINGIDKSERARVLEGLVAGDVDILIGTHSVFQKSVDYSDLALVVIDEQHKFGVDEREALRKKNDKADTLVMTATPIPRSLAMTVYGDMDVSVMKSKPAGRKPVVTFWIDEEKRASVYGFIRDELDEGRQAYVVCPRIDKAGPGDLISAEAVFESMAKGPFKDYTTALMHGRMKADEKNKLMDEFGVGKIKILVTTTLVEVGLDIPNATLMIVEQAHLFGMAQLHQLRGRIGRGAHTSYCMLMG